MIFERKVINPIGKICKKGEQDTILSK